MCIRHIYPFPSPHCQSRFIPLQPCHPPQHVVIKQIIFCPGYEEANYLTCPRWPEEVVWENWQGDSEALVNRVYLKKAS
ncbi:hypothetical protein EYC84_003777 [Monilinia fructicola]|uniref:Uncharacterized protein n=1 Tax=Monilinia fructicola TaxID=38448 RepID=A0A5M9JUU9_MONFR|nr:hypothetical protein EYC84_003777 [Monilinia fructicola]